MLTEEQVRGRLRKRCNELGSQKAMAERLGVSDAYLSFMLTGKKPLGLRALDELGLTSVRRYVKKPLAQP